MYRLNPAVPVRVVADSAVDLAAHRAGTVRSQDTVRSAQWGRDTDKPLVAVRRLVSFSCF